MQNEVVEELVLKSIAKLYGDGKANGMRRKLAAIKEVSVRNGVYMNIFHGIKDADPESDNKWEAALKDWDNYATPADVATFIEDPYYLGLKGEVYPKIMDYVIEINSGKYDEAVLTGAIGTAKTTLALWSNAYQLYLVSLMMDPQGSFGIDHSSEILFVFQSINATLAKELDYARFEALMHGSKYFNEMFRYDTDITSALMFPRRIIVKPITGSERAAIGQNVYGGLIDEVNFMANVVQSKSSIDGGSYDQAVALYDSIVKRRKSRFMKKGKLPGLLCIVSSKRYPGQFTDIREAEAARQIREEGSTTIYIYDKRTWEVLPDDKFSGNWFDLFIGDESRSPRVLEDGEHIGDDDKALVMKVPLEYKTDFVSGEIMTALRDIAGVSTMARHPYFTNREAVAKSFGRKASLLDQMQCDFVRTKLKIDPRQIRDIEKPRWVHMDLSLTGDCTGVSMGYVEKFIKVDRDDFIEILPVIKFDFCLRVQAPPSGEIQYEKLRRLLYVCRDEQGMNVRWVSFDGFQSADSIQILRGKGFSCGNISMDRDEAAYSTAKTAMYDGRVYLPEHTHAQKEFNQLERDAKKGKIDHPAIGSKDVSDSIAGVIYGLTMRREVWALNNIPPTMIPESIVTKSVKVGKNIRGSTEGEVSALQD